LGLRTVVFEEMTRILIRKSVYRAALLGIENAEVLKDTVELNVEWSR